jgi:DNA-binding PadR family transcriptional regulator
MPPTALNTALRSAQRLVALLALHMADRTPGITQTEIRARIRAMNPPSRVFWGPGKGTVSSVVKDALRAGYLRRGRPPDDRRKPLEITPEGRRRLAALRREVTPQLEGAVAFLREVLREVSSP